MSQVKLVNTSRVHPWCCRPLPRGTRRGCCLTPAGAARSTRRCASRCCVRRLRAAARHREWSDRPTPVTAVQPSTAVGHVTAAPHKSGVCGREGYRKQEVACSYVSQKMDTCNFERGITRKQERTMNNVWQLKDRLKERMMGRKQQRIDWRTNIMKYVKGKLRKLKGF